MTTRTSGLLPWFTWGLAALFYCYGFFQRVAPSVMVGDLMRDFGVTAAALGNLSAFYFYAYASLQVPIGLLIDRFGPRRALALAAVLCASGSLLFGLAPSLEIAVAGRLLVGIGAGFTWVGALTVAGAWFPPQRFAFVSGLTLMLGMLGAVAGQVPLAALVGAVGWRSTLLGAAVLGLVIAAAIWLAVRDTPTGDRPRARRETSVLASLRLVLASRQAWLLAVVGAAMTVPLLAFASLWGVPYLMEAHALSKPQAAFGTSLVLIGWAIGAPGSGWLSDRLGRRKLPMAACLSLAIVTFVAAIYTPGLPLPVVFGLLLAHGIASGGMVIGFAATRELHSPTIASVALAFVNMAVMSTGAIFQPLVGWLLDLGWDGRLDNGVRLYAVETYHMALAVMPAFGLVGLLAIALVRETRCRPLPEAA